MPPFAAAGGRPEGAADRAARFRLRAFLEAELEPAAARAEAAANADSLDRAVYFELAAWATVCAAAGYFPPGETTEALTALDRAVGQAPSGWREDLLVRAAVQSPWRSATAAGELGGPAAALTWASESLGPDDRRFLDLVLFADRDVWAKEIERLHRLSRAVTATGGGVLELGTVAPCAWAFCEAATGYRDALPGLGGATPAAWRTTDLGAIGSVPDDERTFRIGTVRDLQARVNAGSETLRPKWRGQDDRELSHPSLIFVILAYNESENLRVMLPALRTVVSRFQEGARVILVDDGSIDGTVVSAAAAASSEHLSLEIVSLGLSRGPGVALRTGLESALGFHSRDALIVTLPADGLGEIDAMPYALERARRNADIVLFNRGRRFDTSGASFSRRLLTRATMMAVRQVTGQEPDTVISLARVYRSSTLRQGYARHGDALITRRGFACSAELLAKLVRVGARVEEVNVGVRLSKGLSVATPATEPLEDARDTLIAYMRARY